MTSKRHLKIVSPQYRRKRDYTTAVLFLGGFLLGMLVTVLFVFKPERECPKTEISK